MNEWRTFKNIVAVENTEWLSAYKKQQEQSKIIQDYMLRKCNKDIADSEICASFRRCMSLDAKIAADELEITKIDDKKQKANKELFRLAQVIEWHSHETVEEEGKEPSKW
jgi:hypothetical protein